MKTTTVLRLRKVKLWPFASWRVVESFKALVWDPTAVRAALDETKQKPRREGE